MGIKEKIGVGTQKLKLTAQRYPLVLLMALLMSISAICLVPYRETDYFFVRLIWVSAIGISVLFAMSMLGQRRGRPWLWNVLGLLFLTAFFFVFPFDEDLFKEWYAFLLIPVLLMTHLLVAVAPYLNRKKSDEKFWLYNKSLFVNFFQTVVFTGVLCLGIMLAITAADHLFDLDIRSDLYFQIFWFILIFGSVLIFLLFTDSGLKQMEKEDKYPVVLKFFVQYVLIPLLCIYVVILYLYAFRILFLWELPEGWLSYLILVYSMVGILALLLVHPLRKGEALSWVRWFGKIFYYSLLPLIFLLFIAIFTRINAYGFTEPRYYVLLLGIWLLFIAMYFIFSKKASIKTIPLSLFLFGLFALIFPYLNTFSVAKRSQKAAFVHLLEDNGLLKDGKIDFSTPVDGEIADEISDKYSFLHSRNQMRFLSNYMSEETVKSSKGSSWNFEQNFTKIENGAVATYTSRWNNTDNPIETEGYDWVVLGYNLRGDGVKLNDEKLYIEIRKEEYILVFGEEKANLTPFIKDLVKHLKSVSPKEEDAPGLELEMVLGGYRFRIVLSYLSVREKNPERPVYTIHTDMVLIRKN